MKIKIANRFLHFHLREDRAVLLTCIGIALIFWLLVKLSQTYRSERPVVLEFDLPEGMTFSSVPPKDIVARLEGAGWDLMFDYFSNPEIRLRYDLQQADALNLNRGQLRSDILNSLSSNDLTITEVNYDNINLQLEKLASRKVPVHLAYRLSFQPEHQLQQPLRPEPDSVTITGPVTLVELIENWSTDSLMLTNLKNSQQVKVDLEEPEDGLSLSTTTVEVSVAVEQFTEKTLFLPLLVQNAPDSVRIFPGKIRLSCVVGLSRYNEVGPEDFTVEVDLQDVPIGEKKNTAPIRLSRSPDFVKAVKFSPRLVEFFLVRQDPPETPADPSS